MQGFGTTPVSSASKLQPSRTSGTATGFFSAQCPLSATQARTQFTLVHKKWRRESYSVVGTVFFVGLNKAGSSEWLQYRVIITIIVITVHVQREPRGTEHPVVHWTIASGQRVWLFPLAERVTFCFRLSSTAHQSRPPVVYDEEEESCKVSVQHPFLRFLEGLLFYKILGYTVTRKYVFRVKSIFELSLPYRSARPSPLQGGQTTHGHGIQGHPRKLQRKVRQEQRQGVNSQSPGTGFPSKVGETRIQAQTKAEFTKKIQRLGALCESRTKELTMLKVAAQACLGRIRLFRCCRPTPQCAERASWHGTFLSFVGPSRLARGSGCSRLPRGSRSASGSIRLAHQSRPPVVYDEEEEPCNVSKTTPVSQGSKLQLSRTSGPATGLFSARCPISATQARTQFNFVHKKWCSEGYSVIGTVFFVGLNKAGSSEWLLYRCTTQLDSLWLDTERIMSGSDALIVDLEREPRGTEHPVVRWTIASGQRISLFPLVERVTFCFRLSSTAHQSRPPVVYDEEEEPRKVSARCPLSVTLARTQFNFVHKKWRSEGYSVIGTDFFVGLNKVGSSE
ncbi:hypothetical protein MRX96_007588 [Rhipicephalus microplus]